MSELVACMLIFRGKAIDVSSRLGNLNEYDVKAGWTERGLVYADDLAAMRAQRDELYENAMCMTDNLDAADKRIEELNAHREDLLHHQGELEKRVETAEAGLDAMTKERDEARIWHGEIKDRIADFTAKLDAANKRIAELEAGLDRWNGLTQAIRDIDGRDENWPTHGNAPLAIAAGYKLRKKEAEAAEARIKVLEELDAQGQAFVAAERELVAKQDARIKVLTEALTEARIAVVVSESAVRRATLQTIDAALASPEKKP